MKVITEDDLKRLAAFAFHMGILVGVCAGGAFVLIMQWMVS